MFTSYTSPKYSSNKKYVAYINEVLPDNSYVTELCSTCGYPLGRHYDRKCPTQKQIQNSYSYSTLELYPEFPLHTLNKIKII